MTPSQFGAPASILKSGRGEKKRPRSSYNANKGMRNKKLNPEMSHSPMMAHGSGVNFTPYSVPNVAKMSASGKQVSFKGKSTNQLPTDLGGMDYLRGNQNGR